MIDKIDRLEDVLDSIHSETVDLGINVHDLQKYKSKNTDENNRTQAVIKRKNEERVVVDIGEKSVLDEIYMIAPKMPKIPRIKQSEVISSQDNLEFKSVSCTESLATPVSPGNIQILSERCTKEVEFDISHQKKDIQTTTPQMCQADETFVAEENVPVKNVETFTLPGKREMITQLEEKENDRENIDYEIQSVLLEDSKVLMDSRMIELLNAPKGKELHDLAKKHHVEVFEDEPTKVTVLVDEENDNVNIINIEKDVTGVDKCVGKSNAEQSSSQSENSGHIKTINMTKVKRHKGRGPGTGPVPHDIRDDTRFYGDVCPRNYSTKYDLQYHKRDTCGKEPERILCGEDGCQESFIHEKNRKEHISYHYTHIPLYTCPNCKRGFYYNRNFCNHKKKCLKKN